MSERDTLVEAGSNELEIIEFFLDHRSQEDPDRIERSHFGVNVAKVWEVIESPELPPRESAPHPCFLGAIPLRDLILPVLDLSIWLGLTKQPNEYEVILVTEFNQTITGFLVSGVTMIHRVSWKDVEPPSSYMSSFDSNCITGMVKLEDHFVLLLDLERVINELDPAMSQEQNLGQVDASGLKALVVDDSNTLRYILTERLTEARFDVETMNNGEEAWSRLLEMQERCDQEDRPLSDFVDIVFSDIEMPRMDGFTLTKQIKEDKDLSKLPVILFSSLITEQLRHRGDKVGADAQISKPEFSSLAQQALELIQARR